jgi:hypothetical protein
LLLNPRLFLVWAFPTYTISDIKVVVVALVEDGFSYTNEEDGGKEETTP